MVGCRTCYSHGVEDPPPIAAPGDAVFQTRERGTDREREREREREKETNTFESVTDTSSDSAQPALRIWGLLLRPLSSEYGTHQTVKARLWP
jgi:hypothetical protein